MIDHGKSVIIEIPLDSKVWSSTNLADLVNRFGLHRVSPNSRKLNSSFLTSDWRVAHGLTTAHKVELRKAKVASALNSAASQEAAAEVMDLTNMGGAYHDSL